ncbi:MAG: hypothetical protein PVI30_10250 [Myxococcales bacterium]|jgi:hypothetical protein
MSRRSRRRGPRKDPEERKDYLIQARVPRDLQSTLKHEAARRRLSVSHLIRNVLEDTFDLVDNVVTEVDHIVSDSVGLAEQVTRDARKVARSAAGVRERPRRAEPEAAGAAEPVEQDDPLAHVLAWNRVVLNRPAECARCGAALGKGSEAHLGLSQDPGAPPAWLCQGCLAEL